MRKPYNLIKLMKNQKKNKKFLIIKSHMTWIDGWKGMEAKYNHQSLNQ